jgi:hypothetical protein
VALISPLVEEKAIDDERWCGRPHRTGELRVSPLLPLLLATLAVAVRCCVGVMFLCAAVSKLRRPTEFRDIVANYQLLPSPLIGPTAMLLPPTELILGLMLLIGLLPMVSSFAAAGFLGLFAWAIGVNLRRGHAHIDCGCTLVSYGQPPNRLHVVRNAVLAALLAVAGFAPADDGLTAVVVGLAGGAVLYLLLHMVNLLVALFVRSASSVKRG